MTISICMECAGVYRVAKTHRMPGRAAGGGAIAPETAARHRGRTQALQILASPFSRFFPLFLKSDVSSFWDRTLNWSAISEWIEVRSQNDETSDLTKSEKKQENDWFKCAGTLVWPLWRQVGVQIRRLMVGRRPNSDRTSKQDDGSRIAMCNWTSRGDVRLERSDMTWLIHTCDMTHSYVWHDSFICMTWLERSDMTWLIHMYDMTWEIRHDITHSYVWHDWHLRRLISRGEKLKVRAWMHHPQRLWFDPCGARRLRG